MKTILGLELFVVSGMDFMFPFVISHGMKYIFLAMDYVSKRVKAITLWNNEENSITIFLKRNIFLYLGCPKLSLVMAGHTSITTSLKPFLRNMV